MANDKRQGISEVIAMGVPSPSRRIRTFSGAMLNVFDGLMTVISTSPDGQVDVFPSADSLSTTGSCALGTHVVNRKWPENVSPTFTRTCVVGCLAQEASEKEMTRAIRREYFIEDSILASLEMLSQILKNDIAQQAGNYGYDQISERKNIFNCKG